jgi:hypothetical protein
VNAIRNVFAALSNLSASVNALAGVIDVATSRLRQSLALDDAVPALPHAEIIEGEETTPSTKRKKAKA